MPAAHPKEFRDDVVAVARRGEAPIAQLAKDFGGYSQLAVVPWLVKRCCRARWALRSRIRAW